MSIVNILKNVLSNIPGENFPRTEIVKTRRTRVLLDVHHIISSICIYYMTIIVCPCYFRCCAYAPAYVIIIIELKFIRLRRFVD